MSPPLRLLVTTVEAVDHHHGAFSFFTLLNSVVGFEVPFPFYSSSRAVIRSFLSPFNWQMATNEHNAAQIFCSSSLSICDFCLGGTIFFRPSLIDQSFVCGATVMLKKLDAMHASSTLFSCFGA